MTDNRKHLVIGFILGFLSLPIALIWGLGWGFGAVPIVAWSMIIGKELHDKHIKNPATGFDLVDIKIGGLGWFIGWIAAGVLFAPMWYLVNFLTN